MKQKAAKILLVDDEHELRELIAFSLTAKFDLEIVEAGNSQEAIAELEKNQDFDLIISDYSMPSGNGNLIIDKIDEMYAEKSNRPEFIFFTSYYANQIPKDDLSRVQKLITKPSFDGSLQDYVKSIIDKKTITNTSPEANQSVTAKAARPLQSHVCLRKKWLLEMPKAYADYYIKLSEEHYVLFVKKGTEKTDESFQRLIDKNDKFAWIKREEASALIDVLMQRLDFSQATSDDSGQAVLKWMNDISFLTNSFYKGLGWTHEVEMIAAKNLKAIVSKMQELPKLRELLLKMKKCKEHYLYTHSSLVTYIAIGVLKEFHVLPNFNQEDLQTLTAAALIHDIALNENVTNKRALYRKNIAENKQIKDESFQLYREHAELAAHVAVAWKNVRDDVEEIVMHHHESPDGKGFPFGYTHAELSPLSSIFIFSHELAEHCLQEEDLNFDKFYEDHKNVYTEGLFKAILNAFKNNLD
ncbi:MAG: response regulator [Bdellovibrionales bacterium]|nr:response regulator [Bdellovibrionales bacterium]